MSIASDVRQGWREFRSRPLVSAVAVVTLALGVAGSTIMFGTLRAIGSGMFPPGADPARVGRVVWTNPQASGARMPLAGDEFARVRAGTKAFDTVAAFATVRLMLGVVEGAPAVSAVQVTADYFRAIGCSAVSGRLFGDQEVRAGARVAVVGEGLAARYPNLRPGRAVHLGGNDYDIVGVMSSRCWYFAPGSIDAWLPMPVGPDGTPTPSSVTVVARLKAAGDAGRAEAEVAALGGQLARTGTGDLARRLRFITIGEEASRRFGQGFVIFLAPALVVLFIACANVTNLLLARAASREREMAVRSALGAGRLRLLRERLAESAWLGVAGGVLGVGLAAAGVKLLRLWAGSFEGVEFRTFGDMVRVDRSALLFALLITLAVPFLCGLVPALSASKPQLVSALHQAPGRRRPRRGPYGGRDLLVIIEIGLAVVLVVMTGMLSRLFTELERVNWAFEPARMLAVEVSETRVEASKTETARRFTEILEALRQVPGADAVSAGDVPPPPTPSVGRPIEFEGCAATGGRHAHPLRVGPGYFAAIALPIRRGRAFTDRDEAGAPLVGVVSEQQAAQCWPGQDPIGRRFRAPDLSKEWITVVGVAFDAVTSRVLPDAPQPVYVPYAQRDDVPSLALVRTAGDPAQLIAAVRAAVRRVDAAQPLDAVGRLDQLYRERTGSPFFITGILGGFSLFALALGALGVFSVMSYMVAERTREFGIRMALGASRRNVLRLVLGQGLTIVAIGTLVSVIGTVAVMRVTFRLLADVATADPVLWAWVAGILGAVAVGASLWPARRATLVEPVIALRAE